MKKKLLGMAAAVMAVSAFSGTSVFAAENPGGTGDYNTEVTYDNRDVATEGDPDQADWGVAVPSKIQFTDDNKNADVSVELVTLNGYTLEDLSKVTGFENGDTEFKATVKVKSKNSMKLLHEKGDSEASYKAVYGDVLVNERTADIGTVAVKIAELKIETVTEGQTTKFKGGEQEGTATLMGTASKLGEHKDTLTFEVDSNLTTKNANRP